MPELLAGPAVSVHEKNNAHFAEFGGWYMPVSYAGTVAEHHAVRSAVGVFDVSHLGNAYVKGKGAKEFVNSILTNDLDKIGPGKAQYTLCTNENGGVIDDLIVYYESDDSLFLVPNAANTAAVVELLQRYAKESYPDLEITNEHRNYAIFAVQGPKSEDVLADLALPTAMDYMAFADASITLGDTEYPIRVCRTGYTGERGYEIIVSWDNAEVVLSALVAAAIAQGGALAGLGARDTLRTEMGYPLHGHELSADITPVQAGASWAVGWKKPHFLGKEILVAEKENGPARSLVGLQVKGKGIPRAGYSIVNAQGEVLGVCTSGTFSPNLAVGIALALIDNRKSAHQELFIDVRGKLLPVAQVKLPFIPSHVR